MDETTNNVANTERKESTTEQDYPSPNIQRTNDITANTSTNKMNDRSQHKITSAVGHYDQMKIDSINNKSSNQHKKKHKQLSPTVPSQPTTESPSTESPSRTIVMRKGVEYGQTQLNGLKDTVNGQSNDAIAKWKIVQLLK